MGLFSSEQNEEVSPLANPEASLKDIYEYLLDQKNNAKGKVDYNKLTNQFVEAILQRSLREKASDVHFDPLGDHVSIRFRIDGELKEKLVCSKQDFPVTPQIRVTAGFTPQAPTAYTPEDGSFTIVLDNRVVRFRVSSFPTINGDKVVIRLLDIGSNILNLEHLGFVPEVLASLKRAIFAPNGIFFVCGITGSGKTTTLCSILKTVNRPEINIMTLEDPVEYMIPHVSQSNINAKAGFNFADGLRAILRQDPNIIMVGEVRDFETAEIAMRAALTGHLIFSTIHTVSAVGVIRRLIDMGIPPFLITESMIGALAQRLVRRICPDCAEPAPANQVSMDSMLRFLPPEEADMLRRMLAAPGAKFMRGRGCAKCQNSGFKGRIGLFELMMFNKELREMVTPKISLHELRHACIAKGMLTLLMDGIIKVRSGITTIEEVQRATAEL